MQNFGLYTAVVLRLISLISHLLMSVWFSICYKIGFNYPTLDCNSILLIKSEIQCWRFAPLWNSSITTWLKNCEKRWYQYKKITRKRFIERCNHNFESKTLNKSIFIVYIGVSNPLKPPPSFLPSRGRGVGANYDIPINLRHAWILTSKFDKNSLFIARFFSLNVK